MLGRNILYVFRRPVTEEIRRVNTGLTPRDIFYGLTEVRKFFNVTFSDRVFHSKLIKYSQYLLNLFVIRFVDIGFSFIPTLNLLEEIKRTDIIFATVDTYGLPIAFLKYLGLVNKLLVFNTIGLYDGLVRKKNPLALRFFQKILPVVDIFISGGSFQECKKLAKLLNLPISKFKFIPFGIDTKYFKPKRTLEKNEIIIIGADPSRDWKLYAKVAEEFPQETFRIITYPGIVKIKFPRNALFEHGLSYTELRRRIWEAKFLLILSINNFHFAGQSTAFRAMSCGKAVIFTNSPGVNEYRFKNFTHCLLVPPGDAQAVTSAIHYLNRSTPKRKQIGQSAHKIISEKYSIEKYSEVLLDVFNRLAN